MKLKRSMWRRGVLAAALTAAGGGAVSLAAAPAGASNTQMTAVGSFTTFFMMHALFPTLNDINPNPLSGSNTQVIAQDPNTCVNGITYSTSLQPPNGSGQGKNGASGVVGLYQEEPGSGSGVATNMEGCIDFARSSSPPEPASLTLPSGGTESGDHTGSNFDYYAYALDGVAPLVGSDAPQNATETGPSNGLTLTQVVDIFSCQVTNWDQITVNGQAGANAPIIVFWPQSGSGTRAVYTDVLGFDPTKVAGTSGLSNNPSQCTTTGNLAQGTTPAAGDVYVGFSANSNTAPNEENSEDGIIFANAQVSGCSLSATALAGTHCPVAEAAYIYSAGKFTSEWNAPSNYNESAANVVATNLGLSTTTIGNFDAEDLSMATIQGATGSSIAGNGQAYVDLTPQVGPFNANTNRGTAAVDGNTVSEPHEWYSQLPSGDTTNPSTSTAAVPGIRYVYNVADTQTPGYNGAKDLVGFDNQSGGTRSALCNGDDAATILAQGFLPLNNGSTSPSGADAAGAACREFAGLSFPGQGQPIHWAPYTFDSVSG